MIKADISTTEGRRHLVEHTTHESYLEGHNITPEMQKLMAQFIAGKMTIDEVIRARIDEASKVA